MRKPVSRVIDNPGGEAGTRGGVIQEFAIVVPLLTIFFGGLVEAGLYVSQVALAGQTAYQAALVGGKTVQSDRLGAMQARAQELSNVLVKKLDSISFTSAQDSDTRVVSFTYQGSVPTLVPGWSMPLSLSVTGPVLMKDTLEVGSLSEFGNGSCLYDAQFDEYCDGSLPPDETDVPAGPTDPIDPDYRSDPGAFSTQPSPSGTMTVQQTVVPTSVAPAPPPGGGGGGGAPAPGGPPGGGGGPMGSPP